MALAQIATKLSNTNVRELKLDEILYYLSRGVEIVGQIQEQWSILEKFFTSLESLVVGPMTRHMIAADDTKQREQQRKSINLLSELAIAGFRAAAVCVNVARGAKNYNEVSRK